MSSFKRIQPKTAKWSAVVTLCIFFTFFLLFMEWLFFAVMGFAPDPQALKGKIPNILLIGSDGLSARHMSVYGYSRDTTPFILMYSHKGVIIENAFSNCSDTLGSVTSILTGKLPTQTKTIYPPDILRGVNAYQHLPGLLRQYGYRTIQVTVRNFADAYESNMRGGFTWVNFRNVGYGRMKENLNRVLRG